MEGHQGYDGVERCRAALHPVPKGRTAAIVLRWWRASFVVVVQDLAVVRSVGAVVVVAVVQVQVGGLACGSVRWVGAAGGRGGGEGERELARVLLLFRVWRWWDRSDAFLDCRNAAL